MAISVKELQIGDWVIFNDKPAQVVIIDNWEDEISYFDADAGGALTFKTKNVNPVALTKEMLEKNGFEFFDSSYFNNNVSITFFSTGIYFTCDVYKDEVCDVIESHINYVHELQHLLRLCGLTEMADNFKIE